MENTLIINNQKYKVVADEVDEEQVAKLAKAMEMLKAAEDELDKLTEDLKEERDGAKEMITLMFHKGNKDFGLKSIKSKNFGITYIPPTEDKIETVWIDEELDKLFAETGLLKADFQKEVLVKGKKGYIKVVKK